MVECPSCSAENLETSKSCSECGCAQRPQYAATATYRTAEKHLPGDASPSSSDSHIHGRFLPGTKIAGRYRIVSLVGKGGMGEVYRADDLKLGQTVALKFLHSADIVAAGTNVGVSARLNCPRFFIRMESRTMRLASFLLLGFAMTSGASRSSADKELTDSDYVNFFRQLTGTCIGKNVTGSEAPDRKSTIDLSPICTCFATYETEDGKPFSHSLDGFDPTTTKYTVFGSSRDGVREVLPLELDRKTLTGTVAGVTYGGHTEGLDADGKPTSCDFTSTIVTRNKLVIKATNIATDGKRQPDITITLTRQLASGVTSSVWQTPRTAYPCWPAISHDISPNTRDLSPTRGMASSDGRLARTRLRPSDAGPPHPSDSSVEFAEWVLQGNDNALYGTYNPII